MFGMCLSREKEAEKKELKKNKADLALRRAEERQRQRRNDALALRAAADRERELDDGRSIHATSQARSSQNASRMSSMEAGRVGVSRRGSDGQEAPRPQRSRPPPLTHQMDDRPLLQPPPLLFSAPPVASVPPPNKLEQSRILELMRRDAATRRNSLSTSTKPPTRSPSPPLSTQSSTPKPSQLRVIKPWKIALLTAPIALLCILLIYDVPLSVSGFGNMIPSSPKLPRLPDVGIPFHPVTVVADGAYIVWDDLNRCWRQLLSRFGSGTITTVVTVDSSSTGVTDAKTPTTITEALVVVNPSENMAETMQEAAPLPVYDEVEAVTDLTSPAADPPVDSLSTSPTEPLSPEKATFQTFAPITKEVKASPEPPTSNASVIAEVPQSQPPVGLIDTVRQGAYSLLIYGIGNVLLAVLAAYLIRRYGGKVATPRVDYRDEIEGQVDPTLVNPGASFERGDHQAADTHTVDSEMEGGQHDGKEEEDVQGDGDANEPKLDLEFEVDYKSETADVDVVAEPTVVGNAAPSSPSPEPFLEDFVVAEKVSSPTSGRGSVDVTRVSSIQQTEFPRATSGTQTLMDIPDVAISAREQALIERMDRLANELGSLGDQALRRRLESDMVQTDHCSDLTTELRGAVSALSSQLNLLKEERTARRSGPPQQPLRRPASAIIQRPIRLKSSKPAEVPTKSPTSEDVPRTNDTTQTGVKDTKDDADLCRLQDALILENRAKHKWMAQVEADQIEQEKVPIELSVEVTPTTPELLNGDVTAKGTPDGIWF